MSLGRLQREATILSVQFLLLLKPQDLAKELDDIVGGPQRESDRPFCRRIEHDDLPLTAGSIGIMTGDKRAEPPPMLVANREARLGNRIEAVVDQPVLRHIQLPQF